MSPFGRASRPLFEHAFSIPSQGGWTLAPDSKKVGAAGDSDVGPRCGPEDAVSSAHALWPRGSTWISRRLFNAFRHSSRFMELHTRHHGKQMVDR